MILVRHGQSEFNVVYSATGRDPGIRDPRLTEEGRLQAKSVAEALRREPVARIVASPFARALETAEIIAGALGCAIEVDSLIRERAAFSCDVGTHAPDLRRLWPHLDLAHLTAQWWTDPEETEAQLQERCRLFRSRMAARPDWGRTVVVSHWAFIRGLTGRPVQNCEALRFDPVAGTPTEVVPTGQSC